MDPSDFVSEDHRRNTHHNDPQPQSPNRAARNLFDTSVVWVDADKFEREAHAGLAALRHGDPDGAAPHLERASILYRGSFLAEDPYAEWLLEERERLRELAVVVLQGHAELLSAGGDLEGAMRVARRLADVEPYDSDIQRFFLGLAVAGGRRGEAIRRYEVYRTRIERTFGTAPDFELRELAHVSGAGPQFESSQADSNLTRRQVSAPSHWRSGEADSSVTLRA